MANYNLKYSAIEYIRLPFREGAAVTIFTMDGKALAPNSPVVPNADQKYFAIAAGGLSIGEYSYAISKEYQGVKKIIQSGRLEIYAGAAPRTRDEKERDAIDEVLLGDDHDIKEINMPDGRIVIYSDRQEMRHRRDVLNQRINYGSGVLRGTTYV